MKSSRKASEIASSSEDAGTTAAVGVGEGEGTGVAVGVTNGFAVAVGVEDGDVGRTRVPLVCWEPSWLGEQANEPTIKASRMETSVYFRKRFPFSSGGVLGEWNELAG